MRTYTFIDFETTGLDYQTNQVIEIAAVKVDENYREIGRFQTMVALNEGVELPEFITELTGIKPEDLANGMNESIALATLVMFIDKSTVVAQNAPFDLSFLNRLDGIQFESFICTRALTKLVEPNENSSLKPTCERHGIKLEGHHRGMNDVLATIEVFKIMKAKADDMGIDYQNVVIDSPERPLRFVPKYARVIKIES
jgi:DNA polymerase III subunit epsilon